MFDFSAVSANVPHRILKSVMGELINFCFNGTDKEFSGIAKYSAPWTSNQ